MSAQIIPFQPRRPSQPVTQDIAQADIERVLTAIETFCVRHNRRRLAGEDTEQALISPWSGRVQRSAAGIVMATSIPFARVAAILRVLATEGRIFLETREIRSGHGAHQVTFVEPSLLRWSEIAPDVIAPPFLAGARPAAGGGDRP
ncbi:hypothetical protein [Roseomonas genomospecies 6]|uniref:Uncharacterized protein n=1 Tax=Roseomonas genomospecies 6 TaxID=214106 RepID=A0A9W7KQL2_9PROT|nr:hypothetical protein [Roseomonas genomospecies 6]KAA0677680.1 hypothetical protein DS843_22845 [Roseomonas genomospecies 6]